MADLSGDYCGHHPVKMDSCLICTACLTNMGTDAVGLQDTADRLRAECLLMIAERDDYRRHLSQGQRAYVDRLIRARANLAAKEPK